MNTLIRNDLVVDSALDSKIHGLSNIIRTKSLLLKIIWIIAFLACSSYCIYQIIVTSIQFGQFTVVPSTLLVHEAPSKFPAVDFCNMNPYDGNTAFNDLNNILSKNNVSLDQFNTIKQYVDKASAVFKSGFEKLALENKFDLYSNGFYLEQMIISCQFQGNPCNSKDFYYYHDYNYGSCFSFNLGKVNNASVNGKLETKSILESKKAGWNNGLQLELYVGNQDKQQKYNFKGGIRIVVHNQSITPFPNDDGIDVATGQQTNVAISKSFLNHLPSPYSECISAEKSKIDWNNNDVFKYMQLYYENKFENYFQKFCLKVCLQKYLIETCNCFDPQFPPNNNNINGCFEINKINCINNAAKEFYASSQVIDCYSKCPIECEYVFYDIESTIANYPTSWYSDLLLANPAFLNLVVNNTPNYTMPLPKLESLDGTILMVNVFYNNLLNAQTNEEPKMTFDILMSYAGGNFCLFLGISFLSLIELFEMLYFAIYIRLKKH